MQNILFLPIVKTILPRSWHIIEASDLYLYSQPFSRQIPPSQGWKIFVSCHFFNTERIIREAARSCVEKDIPFKFVRSRLDLTTLLGKAYPRAESAKAVVIYPPDTAICRETLKSLAEALNEVEAPPVLSGRRFANAPVYYRYGANSASYLRHPVTGECVDDPINPWYASTPWVDTDPFQPDLDVIDTDADANRTGDIVLKDRFRIQEAIYFSNSGGLYLAMDIMTDARCCLKEARPWMAPHPFTGEDAVARLYREADTLEQTQSVCVVPKFIDRFMEDGHAFLAREYIDGETLAERKARQPFRASEIKTLRHALEAILALKEILGEKRLDLSPQNVVFDGAAIKLIDLETDLGPDAYTWGTQGFIPPPGVCPWQWGIQALLDFCRC